MSVGTAADAVKAAAPGMSDDSARQSVLGRAPFLAVARRWSGEVSTADATLLAGAPIAHRLNRPCRINPADL